LTEGFAEFCEEKMGFWPMTEAALFAKCDRRLNRLRHIAKCILHCISPANCKERRRRLPQHAPAPGHRRSEPRRNSLEISRATPSTNGWHELGLGIGRKASALDAMAGGITEWGLKEDRTNS
jgi:hypothetical protein